MQTPKQWSERLHTFSEEAHKRIMQANGYEQEKAVLDAYHGMKNLARQCQADFEEYSKLGSKAQYQLALRKLEQHASAGVIRQPYSIPNGFPS